MVTSSKVLSCVCDFVQIWFCALGSKDKGRGMSFFKKKILVVPFSLFRGSPHTEKFVYFILNHFLLIFVVIFKGGFPQIKS